MTRTNREVYTIFLTLITRFYLPVGFTYPYCGSQCKENSAWGRCKPWVSAGGCCGPLSPERELGWWIDVSLRMACEACRWCVLAKWAPCKGGSTEVDTSWRLRRCAMPQAGNRARKSVQRAQWWDSTPECRPVPSARPKAARLPTVFFVLTSEISPGKTCAPDHPDSISGVNGHTASNTPDPIRTRKLSGARPGQYWGGGPPGKPFGCR